MTVPVSLLPKIFSLSPNTQNNTLQQKTEEGIKVARMKGRKFFAVFRRRTEEEVTITPPIFDLFTT